MRERFTRINFLLIVFAVFLLIGAPGCGSKDRQPTPKNKKMASKGKQKKKSEKKAKLYKVGYQKHGIKKVRGDIELYTPEELESLAPPSGPKELSVVITGDILTWDRMKDLVENDGFDYPFRGVAPILKNADFSVGNLEGPLTKDAQRRSTKGYFYKVPPKTVQGLVDAGFDAVTLANNHLLDCNEKGLQDTMKVLDDAKIKWFGAGDSNEKAREPLIVKIKGLRVAMLGGISPEIYLPHPHNVGNKEYWDKRELMCKRDLTMLDGYNTMGTFIYTPETLAEDITRAKKKADVVIVNLHWGVRYWKPPYELQVALAKAAEQAGADIVVGHHAHFWQPVGMIGQMPVIYGIGNFAFGSRNPNADEGLLVRIVFSTESKKLKRVELFPTYIKNRDKQVNYQTKLFKGASAKAVLEDIRTWSSKLCNTDMEISGDRIVIELPYEKKENENEA